MVSTLAGLGVGLIAFLVLALLISAFFLWIGAKLAGIRGASFGKAVLAALVSVVALAILEIVLSLIPRIGGTLGLLLGILVSIYVIKAVFDTGWGKAILAWIMYIAAIIVAGIITAIFGAAAIWSVL
jgi:hypothetical protein